MKCKTAACLLALSLARPPAYGQPLMDIQYSSSADRTPQKAMFWAPETEGDKVPLVVALHTWSGDYKQGYNSWIAKWCQREGWAYIHPDFRGRNNRPEATGSDLAVQDIVDAVDYAKRHAAVNEQAVFLVGASGGGHAALLMAGRHPELWTGVSAWVPIFDLRAWHAQGRYVADMEKSCGGAPGDNPEVDEQYRLRSPSAWLTPDRHPPLQINAGIHDGHTGSVPISHALRAFNAVAAPQDRLTDAEIEHFVTQQAVPPHLSKPVTDAAYGKKTPLFRRRSNDAMITIFEGGHEMVAAAAVAWFQSLLHTNP